MNKKEIGKKRKLRSKIVLKLPLLSGFFGALGPYFNKQATLDSTRWVYSFFIAQNCWYMIYPFDFLCIFCMLWVNTLSVKYKMLSYKYDGAFIGTTFIFILGYLFSSALDYVLEGKIMSDKRIVGALCIILGVLLISFQEAEQKVFKRTNSVLILVDRITSSPQKPDGRAVTGGRVTEEETEVHLSQDNLTPSKQSPTVESLKEPLVDKTVEYVEPTYKKREDDAISQQPQPDI